MGDIKIDPDSIIKSGWLLKQSKYLKDWRRRWLVLTKNYLLSYKDCNSDLNDFTEVLNINNCSTVKSIENMNNQKCKNNAFKVESNERKFFLVADDQKDKERWIGFIGRQMIKPSVVDGFHDIF